MAADFTIVIRVRQKFGDRHPEEIGLDLPFAPTVGLEKDFEFQCPNVDPNQEAVLLFQSQGGTRNTIEINGHTLSGGIEGGAFVTELPVSPGEKTAVAQWNGNILLVRRNVLSHNNVLRIRAGEVDVDKFDNFVIDNVVVVFKTL